jgi:hypothetical protein
MRKVAIIAAALMIGGCLSPRESMEVANIPRDPEVDYDGYTWQILEPGWYESDDCCCERHCACERRCSDCRIAH